MVRPPESLFHAAAAAASLPLALLLPCRRPTFTPSILAPPTEGLAIMTSRDFLSLVEAMHALLSRAGVRGLAALAQQQQVLLWVFRWAWLIAAHSALAE